MTDDTHIAIGALPDPIPDPLVELLAGRLRVIGDQTRIRVLDRLRHGPASVQELVDAAGTSQQNVSTKLGQRRAIARAQRAMDAYQQRQATDEPRHLRVAGGE